MAYASTKLSSSRGQVVIPEEVRNDLRLNEGDQFVVIDQRDAVILKVITPPKLEEFQELLSQARAEGKSRNQESTVEIRHCQSQAQVEVTIKAILDTNVVISGIFWKGPPFEILMAWQRQRFHLALSVPILDEYLG
jgi:AbrB family looped-hinge helix DNA binding protein